MVGYKAFVNYLALFMNRRNGRSSQWKRSREKLIITIFLETYKKSFIRKKMVRGNCTKGEPIISVRAAFVLFLQ